MKNPNITPAQALERAETYNGRAAQANSDANRASANGCHHSAHIYRTEAERLTSTANSFYRLAS